MSGLGSQGLFWQVPFRSVMVRQSGCVMLLFGRFRRGWFRRSAAVGARPVVLSYVVFGFVSVGS